jgi:hypothetical protein
MPNWTILYEQLKAWIEDHGVKVLARQLPAGTTGVFDGLTITTNTTCDLETRCYNIAHSFGHIVQWSLEGPRFQALYDDLHAAKENKQTDPDRLQSALLRFRQYEEEASQYAAWLLIAIGHAEVIPRFTNFARADIEAIVAFHRDGQALPWARFFQEWQAKVATADRPLRSFEPRPIPALTPVFIDSQEVIQEVEK